MIWCCAAFTLVGEQDSQEAQRARPAIMAASGLLSPAERAPGVDGRRDEPDDLRNDEISAFQYAPADLSDVAIEEPIDPWDAADVMRHRKKTDAWTKSRKKVHQWRAAVQEERPSLTTLHTDAMLLRNAAIPDAVWTVGDSSQGQCGHRSTADSPEIPHPAALDLQTLRDGIHGLYAGPYCTLAVTKTGQALGFGSGPFRSAAEPPPSPPPSHLASDGAPPIRVARPAGRAAAVRAGSVPGGAAAGAGLPGSALAAARAWAAVSSVGGDEATSESVASAAAIEFGDSSGSVLGDAVAGGSSAAAKAAAAFSFDRTEEAVHASIRRRAAEQATPTALSVLNAMPVHALAMGEDFCIALMDNGMVMAWGDGEEGKLGLGQPHSQSRPTIVDFLLPTHYAEVAKQADNRDELLKAGSRLIHTRGKAFQITSIACGARHTIALSSTAEVFTWGSGCMGQLGHSSRHDEMLPRPVEGLRSRGLRAQVVAAGAYHSCAIIGVSKRDAAQLFSWGDNEHGRLGHGDERTRTAPQEVHYHRLQPRRRLQPREDSRASFGFGFFSASSRGDWLGLETGHELQFFEVACGAHHTIALTRKGELYTWGADDASQLGHGLRVTQRLPTLLTTLQRPLHGTRRRMVSIADTRGLGCGRRFSAALTWGGEVWVWGQLGGVAFPRPTMLQRLQTATVVGIACGADHLAMVTGDLAELHARAEEAHVEDVRREAAEREHRNMQERVRQDLELRRAAEEQERARREEVLNEKRRVQLLGRLAKQRARMEGLQRRQGRRGRRRGKDEDDDGEADAKKK